MIAAAFTLAELMNGAPSSPAARQAHSATLLFVLISETNSKKKIIAEMEGMAGGNLMEEGRP